MKNWSMTVLVIAGWWLVLAGCQGGGGRQSANLRLHWRRAAGPLPQLL